MILSKRLSIIKPWADSFVLCPTLSVHRGLIDEISRAPEDVISYFAGAYPSIQLSTHPQGRFWADEIDLQVLFQDLTYDPKHFSQIKNVYLYRYFYSGFAYFRPPQLNGVLIRFDDIFSFDFTYTATNNQIDFIDAIRDTYVWQLQRKPGEPLEEIKFRQLQRFCYLDEFYSALHCFNSNFENELQD